MKFDLSNVEMSRNDVKGGIKLPKIMTTELAEFIGIMVGDGHIGNYGVHRVMTISGNLRDRKYYEEYVNELILKVFNIKFNICVQKSKNTFFLRRHSKGIFNFLTKVIGLPTRKDFIGIPLVISKNSNKIKIAFIRGLADADFCITFKRSDTYPVIQAAFKSKLLTKQTKNILNEFGIRNCYFVNSSYDKRTGNIHTTYRFNINGHKNVKKYMNTFGFCNPYHLKRYYKNPNIK